MMVSIGCDGRADDRADVLRVANWGGPANISEFLQLDREIQTGFERLRPDRSVRVMIEQIPGEGQYTAKLMMMHLCGGMPDVVHLDASSAAIFIDNDVLTDLSERIARDDDIAEDMYFKNVFDIARRGERVYAIPLDFTPMVVVYNKDLFDQAGVEHPREDWTWDEFMSACAALKAHPPPSAAAWYPFDFFNWMPGWFPFIWSAGGDVISADGRRASGHIDSPHAREALQFLADLILVHGYAPRPAARAAIGKDLFRNRMAAMTMTGHWMMLEYRRDGLNVGVTSIPRKTRRVSVIYECGLAIPRAAANPDLAWEYIKYMTSQTAQTRRNSTGLAISGNRAAAESLAKTEVERAFLREVEFALPPWGSRVERYPMVEDLGWELMEDVLHGRRTVDDAAAYFARLMDAELGH
ncbi:MAG: sugar ABC transporter substrate-binding protein [Phycisphaerales bacterium]|nr:sugar ABC transporter substrate-binding protein [Phycisphaerales bacterium]